jgi:hypothetical protein
MLFTEFFYVYLISVPEKSLKILPVEKNILLHLRGRRIQFHREDHLGWTGLSWASPWIINITAIDHFISLKGIDVMYHTSFKHWKIGNFYVPYLSLSSCMTDGKQFNYQYMTS